MQPSEAVERCRECSGAVIDAGDELVCNVCGAVKEKESLEGWSAIKSPRAMDYTNQVLGGYLGPLVNPTEARGFSQASSTFDYLKKISDFAGRDDSTLYSCVGMIERVCEKLSLPGIVAGQAVVIAKKLLTVKRSRTDITTAAVSAYAVIIACKIERVTSVGVREIVEAYRLLGRRVKTSALIELSLSSQVHAGARKAEDYIGRVVAQLSSGSLSLELRERGSNPAAYFSKLRQCAEAVLAAVDQPSRGGHSPCTLAATAVYAGETVLARKEGRRRFFSQRRVASCVRVAEYTVREQYGEVFRPLMGEDRLPA